MAIKGYLESSLATSDIFSGINDNNVTLDKVKNLIRNAKHITNEDIEAAYISVKQITDSLTREALKAFDNEQTVLLYNNIPELSVTQTLPFITLRTRDTFVTYVFMDKYISISRDGVMTMQAPILRDLLIGALISNCLKRNYSNLATNQYLQKVLMEIYTKFVTRIFNREFSIAADKVVFDVVQYWVAKFFLLNVFNAQDTPDNIETLATSHFKYIDEVKYEDIKQQYENTVPQKIGDLLELVKTASPRMKAMNKMTFISDWINYYYVPSTMAIDTVEYLIFMIITLLSGNNIISISASDIVKESRNIKAFRSELLKLI